MKPAPKRNGAAVAPQGRAAAVAPAAAAAAVPLTLARVCACEHGPILHVGAKSDGRCLICASCTAYREANHG